MQKLKTFLFIFLSAILLFTLPKGAFADTKETTSAAMSYTVDTTGNTHVVAHISLTNTTQNYYVSSYSLKLGFPTVSNLSASDPDGPTTPTLKPTDSGPEITIPIQAVVAGLGKTLSFTLSFDTPDIATQNGELWEVNIPGLANQNDFQDVSVDVVVPSSFGKPTAIKPNTGSTSLHFTKDQLGASGVSLTFGSKQTYAYSLSYHIQNKNLFPIKTEIALPPTTNYQDVSLDSLSPKPDNVVLDTDGNWMAQYSLSPSQKMTVIANGLIALSLQPKSVALSDKERKLFLEKQSYWQVNNNQIITLAKNLKTPKAIYDYVVAHLHYDFARVKNEQVRVGAAGVLQNPASSVCLEFTDLFITLSRAAGIPAREIDGFGYTQNTISRPLLSKDILHAWPEYYDDSQKTWVMVDPTWGNTTGGVDYFHQLDFDHIAFVVKGASSTYPIPAGGYKYAVDGDNKDVSIAVAQGEISAQPAINIQLFVPSTTLSGIPMSGSVTLENTGSVLFPSQPVDILTTYLTPREQLVLTDNIPPLGKATKYFSFGKTPLLTNHKDTITIALSGKTLKADVSIVPLTNREIIIGGILLAIFAPIIWIATTRSRRLPISR
ncbi:MAG TPA: transglutaminase-like domain-containing protein [Candidatus Eisenbacteria bacterium]|nr:transglutaminase-like domain-containing protein [Candidatus Eisenbacteria bacterium]